MDLPRPARVVVLDDYERAALRMGPWDRLAGRVEVEVHHARLEGEALRAVLQAADVIVVMRERTVLDAPLLAALRRPRLIVTTGLRNAAIDVAAAQVAGISVCGTQASVDTTAELTWALVLACARRITEHDRRVRRGDWRPDLGTALRGRTLGLLGLGRIGGAVARYGVAFGMEVVGWSPTLTSDRAAEHGARRVERDALFASADVLSIHARLTPDSRGSVGARELSLLPAGAIVVNTARAHIVGEAALREAVSSERIGGLGLDVHWDEPAKGTEWYLDHGNVVVSPHTGYVTDTTFASYFADVVEDIEAFLDGRLLREVR